MQEEPGDDDTWGGDAGGSRYPDESTRAASGLGGSGTDQGYGSASPDRSEIDSDPLYRAGSVAIGSSDNGGSEVGSASRRFSSSADYRSLDGSDSRTRTSTISSSSDWDGSPNPPSPVSFALRRANGSPEPLALKHENYPVIPLYESTGNINDFKASLVFLTVLERISQADAARPPSQQIRLGNTPDPTPSPVILSPTSFYVSLQSARSSPIAQSPSRT